MGYKIMLLGEAWGAQEEAAGRPFVGYAGHQLNSMLGDAGITRGECYVTNVFNFRPDGNKIESLCGDRDDGIQGYPALTKGGFVRAEYASELGRLAGEISRVNPNIIVALGNTPSWALFGRTGITKHRGTTELTTHTAIGFKALATYHPQACNYMPSWRTVAVMDLMKAKRESEYPDVRRPERQIYIPESIDDLYIAVEWLRTISPVAVDIETSGTRITCIGFGDRQRALVIPFDDTRKKAGSYWPDPKLEHEAWRFVRDLLNSGNSKVFQNGLYDIAFLWRSYGIAVRNPMHDTMLLHHALQPESLKSLGFLGSVYTDEGAWKNMRSFSETIKREE